MVTYTVHVYVFRNVSSSLVKPGPPNLHEPPRAAATAEHCSRELETSSTGAQTLNGSERQCERGGRETLGEWINKFIMSHTAMKQYLNLLKVTNFIQMYK